MHNVSKMLTDCAGESIATCGNAEALTERGLWGQLGCVKITFHGK